MRAHLAERHDDSAAARAFPRRLREQRRVEHEVLRRDDRRAAPAEEQRDVAPREAPADDERPAACLASLHASCLPRRGASQVSVIGSGAEWEAAAEEVGRLLAERGCTVVTGGLDEVMAAAHRGAKAAGGTTIAILPGEQHDASRPVGRPRRRHRDRPRAEPRGRGFGSRRDRRRRQLGNAGGDRVRDAARAGGVGRVSRGAPQVAGVDTRRDTCRKPSSSRYETSARRRSR